MIRKDTLPGGLRVVSEEIPYAQSVSVGLWVKTGSRHEDFSQAGISHFLEHMNFKGTSKRSARDLAEVLECRGGQLNAFTAKEYTTFYCRAVKEDLGLAIDVLEDLFRHSLFDNEDTEKEKKVVLEEINLYDDSPEDLIIDLLNETCWPQHALGRPILGYEEQVNSFTPEILREYRKNRYTPDNTVIGIIGAFDHEEALDAVNRCFGDFKGKAVTVPETAPTYHNDDVVREKEITQEHICLAFPACSFFDEDYITAVLVNEYLGGGASSLLFQKIREELALSYAVYSFLTAYEDTGLLSIYAGTSPECGAKVKELCLNEVEKLVEKGIDEEALVKLKNQINGSMRLSVDSLGSRLSRLGRNELFHRRNIPVEEIVSKVNGVSVADFSRVSQKIFDFQQMSSAFLGGKSWKE